jgi:hypothetical protein
MQKATAQSRKLLEQREDGARENLQEPAWGQHPRIKMLSLNGKQPGRFFFKFCTG